MRTVKSETRKGISRVKFFGATDTGLVREDNQDSYIIAFNEAGDVFVIVCDGIGGSQSGDVASMTAINYLSSVFSATSGFDTEESLLDWLRIHLSKANDEIFSLASTKKEYQGMGTTLVGLLLSSQGQFVVNLGDSRCYALFQNGVFQCCTVDHNLLNDLVKSGEVSLEEASRNKKKNYLTNALGIWNNVKADVFRIKDPVKRFLLCTDGLHGYISPKKIEELMKETQPSLKNRNRKMVDTALKAGGYDNVTVVLVEMEEGQ